MNDSNQISLSGMIWGVVTVSLLIAATTTASPVVLLFATFMLCLCLGCYCSQKKFQPWYSGAAVGFAAPALLSLNLVATTVMKAEIVQGELYTEDGPLMLFAGGAMLMVVPGGILAIVGAAVWTALAAISQRNWDKFDAVRDSDGKQ
jgi:hypothetical protein